MSQSMDVFVRAVVNAEGNIGKRMRDFSRSVGAASNAIVADASRAAGALTRLVSAAAAAMAGLIGRNAIKGGIEFNAMIEEIRLGVAATLTMYDYLPAGIAASASEHDKLNARIATGEKLSRELVKIAAESPGQVRDIERMYMTIAPAVLAYNGSLQDSLALTQRGAIMAAMMENNFILASRQLAAIVSGGAGKAQRTFRLLGPPILKVAETMPDIAKHFQGVAVNTRAFTQAWNQSLNSMQRGEVLLRAMDGLTGPIADAYAESWEGSTAAMKSSWDYLRGELTKPLFKGLKREFVRAVGAGGVFNFGGEKYEKLLTMMHTAGVLMAKPILGAVRGSFNFALYVADHWEEVMAKMMRAFNRGMLVAKLLLVAKATKFAVSAPIAMMSSMIPVISNLGGIAAGVMMNVSSVLGAMIGPGMGMVAALALAPVMLAAVGIAFMAIGGVFVVVAGLVAHFIENFGALVASIRDGSTSVTPLFTALDFLWAKLAAAGKAFMGVGDTGSYAGDLVMMVAEGFTFLTDIFGTFLQVAVIVMKVWNGITLVIGAVATGIVAAVEWMAEKISTIMNKLGFGEGSSEVAMHAGHMKEALAEGAIGDLLDMERWDKTLEAYQNARPKGESAITKWAREKLDAAFSEGKANSGGKSRTVGGGGGRAGEKSPNVNIHTLYATMDLRNQDPDRIVSVFWEDLAEKASRPLSSPALIDHGV